MRKILNYLVKILLICSLLSIVAVFNSCEKGNENGKGKSKLKINFSNPQAMLLKNNAAIRSAKLSSLRASGIENETTLFQITENGDVSSVIEGVVITEIKTFSYGAYVKVDYGDEYIIFLDNTYIKLSNVGEFVGENEEGDLIFSDVSMIKKGSTEIKKMQTALSNPTIGEVSGNFAIIYGEGNIKQIYNTVGGERYNLGQCSGPTIALDKNYALTDTPCDGKNLIDMRTGNRTESDFYQWQEAVYMGNGAVILDLNGKLSFANTLGNSIDICDGFAVGDGFYSVLFVSDNHYIVRELTQISVVKKGESTKKSILTGYNIISVSVTEDKVFFIAEDNLGNKETGFYSLTTEEVSLANTQEEFDSVYTFN